MDVDTIINIYSSSIYHKQNNQSSKKHLFASNNTNQIKTQIIQKLVMRKQVDRDSSQWNQVDFQLQLITGKSSIKLISLFKLSQDPIHEQIFRTDAIINVTDFGKDYVESVRRKSIPLEDLIIYCGHVNIHSQSIQGKIFTFLITKVALGKKGTTLDDVTKLDSILLQNQGDRNSFQYNFFLRAHEQYHLRYEVNFTVGQDREFNLAEFRCASCQNRQAALYCRAQRLYFCDTCSADHHRTKIMQGHELEKIDKINTLPICKTHSQKYTHYCIKCEKYLCTSCIQKGGSHGNSDHPFYPIQQLYQEKRQINEVLTTRQKEKIQNLLRSLQHKKQEVNQNAIEVKKFIERQRDRAIGALEQLTIQKSILLSSDELELRMLNQKIDWAKAFLKYQQKTLKPIFYLRSQQRFERDLQKTKISQFESIFTVRGDLAAEGQLFVAKKQVLQRQRSRGPSTQRTEERYKTSRVSANNSQPRNGSLYEYNASAQTPHRGQLCTLLQNTELNFFTLSKQN